MGFPLLLYRFFLPFSQSRLATSYTPGPNDVRPDAPMIWLHSPEQRERDAVRALINDIHESDPDVWFLVTTNDGEFSDTPVQTIVTCLPMDQRKAINAFLSHWQPDCCGWTAPALRPELLQQTANRGVPLVMIDTGSAIQNISTWRTVPGLTRETLACFDWFLIGDEATRSALLRIGIEESRTEVMGVLEAPPDPPRCNMSERDELSAMLAGRPVWLAAGINSAELGAVLGAHKQIVKRAHRLLLIVVPGPEESLSHFRREISKLNFEFGERENADDPTPEMQVYLADTDEELGLWYRLASVAFIGQTLAEVQNIGPDPFAAASLGSAIIHGPGLAPYRHSFLRLGRAGAAVQVTHSAELAENVDRLLAPSLAAELANAAWRISTAGAEVQERAADLLISAVLGEGF